MSVVILTGASRGIGAAIAHILLACPSNKVLAVARSEAALKELADTYGGDRVAYVAGDISSPEISDLAIDLAVQKFGRIDAIIANAGVLDPVDPVRKANVPKWKALFDVNFFSIVDLVSKALPQLRKTNGKVVLVSSGASTKPYNGWAAYGASKAALNHFAQSLASEESDIKVISVAPGVVDTQMQNDIRDVFGQNMTAEALKRFTDLKENKELLDPQVPAVIYANLATRGFGPELNGLYLRYNDAKLATYSDI